MSGARFAFGADGTARLRIDTPADLAAAIVLTQQAGAIGQAHLMRALLAGEISFLPLLPDMPSRTFKAFLRGASRPAVVVIGDDGDLPQGPAGRPLAARALRWSRATMIHAAGAELAHYEAVIDAAQQTRRALVIECGTATLPAWLELAADITPHAPTLAIVPRNGAAHPVAMDRGRVQ